jgi:chromosome partitioning protein
METITLANLKGGVGKTTITNNLGGVLSRRGKRVLLVDMDHQANLSSIYIPGLMGQEADNGLTKSLFQGAPLGDLIRPTAIGNVSIVPSDLDLNLLDSRFSNDLDAHFLLADALATVEQDFDYCLIDCPPHLGMAVQMALVAANGYIVPLTADYWSYRGSQRIRDAARKTQTRANKGLAFRGYVLSRVQARNRFTHQMTTFFRENFGDELKGPAIRESIKYREASASSLPITHYLPASAWTDDFVNLANNLNL